MAEKEERILIQVMDDWCQYRYLASVNHLAEDGSVISNDEEVVCHREDNWGEICDDKCCEQCKEKEMLGISRQEAIRKMCDAYFKAKDKGLMESERVVAALNALLEEK